MGGFNSISRGVPTTPDHSFRTKNAFLQKRASASNNEIRVCGEACLPQLSDVRRHNEVVVKSFASDHCGPVRFPAGAKATSDA